MTPVESARSRVYQIAAMIDGLEEDLHRMSVTENNNPEVDMVVYAAAQAMSQIMLAAGRKHPPYTFLAEPENEHIYKAVRHLQSYLIQRDGYQPVDGEDHMALALTRIAMAITKRAQPPQKATA